MALRVDIVTGETVLHRTDLRLPGYIPLTLARTYRSGCERSGPFGYGWRLNWEITLQVASDEITYAPGTPHETTFSPVDVGMEARYAKGVLIQHDPDAYVVIPAPSRRLVFEKENAWRNTIPLSRIEDPDGNDIHVFYDRERIAGLVDTLGRQVRFDYRGGQVRRIRIIGADGLASTIRTFQYNGQDLAQETDAEGFSASFGYQRHLMVEYTRRNGGTQYVQYDGNRQCLALWYADGSEARRFAYDKSRQSTRVVQGDGRQIVYRHVHPGQVLKRIDALDRGQNYYYDEAYELIGFSDDQGSVQTFQRLDTEEGTGALIDSEERFVFLEMDERLRVNNVRDAFENQQTLSYSVHNRPVALQTPTGATWTFGRNNRGAVTEVISPSGTSVRLTRSSDERTLVIEDGQGGRIEDHFDECGRLVERTDALNRRFQWRYDANNRLQSVHVGRQSMAFSYSPGGQPVRVVDARGRATKMTYDAFGRLKKFETNDRPYLLDYNSAGRVATVTGPQGRTTQCEYAENGHVERIRHADGRETTYNRIDEGVEVTTDREEGQATVLYNQAGDPVRWKEPDGPEYLLNYGPSGELLSADRGGDSLYFGYDEEGRVVRVTKEGQTLSLDYDADGGIDTVHVDGQRILQSQRDARGRPVMVVTSSQSFQLAYDAGDRLRTVEGANQKWEFEYNALDCLEKFQGPGDLKGENPTLEGRRVQTHLLGTSEGSDGQERRTKLKLHMARHGVVLSVQVGAWCIPIWRQGTYLSPMRSIPSPLIAATLVCGDRPLVASLQPVFALRLPQCWQRFVKRGVRDDYTEIPRLTRLRCFSWTLLDHFFLNRSFYEMSYQALLPDRAMASRVRSPDVWTTGAHVASQLRPPIWRHRATGPYLYDQKRSPQPELTNAIDILDMICGEVSWK